MLDFITSTGGKLIGGLLLAFLLSGGLMWAIHRHDVGVLASAQVSSDRAIAAANAANARLTTAALEAQATTIRAQSANSASIREKTHAAPVTTACVTSPAVRALIGGLQHNSNGASAKH